MNSLKVGFTGDFCPWERVEQVYNASSWTSLFADVQPFFRINDFNVIDLECPLTRANKGISKTGPLIKSDPSTAEILKHLNCRLVVTANNHFKDYDLAGMEDSYHALKKHDIDWLGSGSNLKEASKIAYIEGNGLKVALINMAENEWSTTHGDEPGCNPIDYPRALLSIQEAQAAQADFVVVILHGGHEHYPLPSPRMKAQFRFMIDAGADAVVGHHTHIISGFEVYKGKPIFYGLGNFCFDWPGLRNGTWNKGMLLRLIFSEKGGIEFEYKYIRQNDEYPGLNYLDEDEIAAQEKEIARLNMIIADDRQLAEHFSAYCEKLAPVMLTRIQPYRNKYLTAMHKRGILPDIIGPAKRKILQIFTQCESHREALLYALNKKES